jgi:hypothetical protein
MSSFSQLEVVEEITNNPSFIQSKLLEMFKEMNTEPIEGVSDVLWKGRLKRNSIPVTVRLSIEIDEEAVFEDEEDGE